MTMRVGVHEQYQGPSAVLPTTTRTRFPLAQATREFVPGVIKPQDLVARLVKNCQKVWDAGLIAVWSFKPSPAEVARGAWKPYILALAKYIKANKLQDKVVVVIWHEPENDLGAWFKDAAAFVTLFNTIHDLIMSVDPTIKTCHSALGYRYADKIDITDAVAKKWVTKATINAIDLYSGQSFPLAMTLGDSTAFKRWKASRPAGAVWAVTERGWIATAKDSAARAAAIAKEADYLAALPAADKPAYYLVWNTEGTEDNANIILDDAGVAAVNAMFTKINCVPPAPPKRVICPQCKGKGTIAG